jgi:hypothetical protein
MSAFRAFHESLRGVPPARASKALDDWKENVLRSRYKELALENHPDKGGDEEKMKELSAAFNLLKQLNIIPRRPPPVVRVFVQPSIRIWNTDNTGTASTNTTTGGGWVRID